MRTLAARTHCDQMLKAYDPAVHTTLAAPGLLAKLPEYTSDTLRELGMHAQEIVWKEPHFAAEMLGQIWKNAEKIVWKDPLVYRPKIWTRGGKKE